ncbi:hypothetical protein [Pedobacter nototheniae]|uniref:hypothetical protein n=1 Tax=Pedobacter nototheniae TaxID=2488994 RepID=UPI00292E4FCD|nr:hypothetical protein [Pedobacter nototheniae]
MKRNFKTSLFISLILTGLSFMVNAQEVEKKNSIYAELLGNGGAYSLNYDRLFQVSKGLKVVPRVGLSTLQQVIIVPLEVNLLISKSNTSKNFFETGIGVTILKPLSGFHGKLLTVNGYDYNFDNKTVNTPLIIRAGFRHQKPVGGFMYRAGALLFTGDETILTIGLALGYSF